MEIEYTITHVSKVRYYWTILSACAVPLKARNQLMHEVIYDRYNVNSKFWDYHRRFAFVCCVQEEDVLAEIAEMIGDDEITAATFMTEWGDWDYLHVRYGYASFRNDDSSWYSVECNWKGVHR